MTVKPRRHRYRRHKSLLAHKLTALAFLTMCLATLFAPSPNPASAGPDLGVTDCPQFQRWDADQGKCVAILDINGDEDEAPTVPIDVTETEVPRFEEPEETPEIDIEILDREPTPTQIPIDIDIDIIDPTPDTAGSGSVTINKHRCPAGFDASGASYNDLAASCTESPNGILFGISDGASEIATGTTGSAFPGGFQVDGLPLEGTAIYEKNVPDGGTSVIFCDGYTADEGGPSNWENFETIENQMFHDFGEAPLLYCDWFNVVPAEAGSATLIITKHLCPAMYDASAEDYYDLAANCHEAADGIEFGVSDGATEIASAVTGSAFPNGLQIDGLPAGAMAIYEKGVPDTMYSVVFCDGMLPTDSGPADFVKVTQTDANQIFYIFSESETLYCDWFNVHDMPATPETGGYGDVTIYKWICPEGFEPNAPGADPASTCTDAMDGVTFTMDRPGKDPLVSTTGDSISSAVAFAGQDAGDYTITESLPQGFASAFVWDCTGGGTGWVHPTPLVVGTSLTLTVAAGDAIVCNWYNIPETAPDTGHLTVIKFTCSGPVYVSDIDCEIYEYGMAFDLLTWNGNGWSVADTQVTSANGTITWNNLDAGSYGIDEQDAEPCHIAATNQDAEGNYVVHAGQETVVNVFNCTAPGATPVTGKTPVKFPNTGVTQEQDATQPAAQESEPINPAEAISCPAISEPNTGSEPTLESNSQSADTCPRGQVPARLTIDSIEVDAEVEVLEIVDGTMQEPTTADVVSWYKETGRLGEPGNIVIAGHLNYWGDPEGVFFDLAALEEGDIVTLTGPDGDTYRYEVTWTEEVSTGTLPTDVTGPTEVESLTLITCSGEWNAAASEYDHRTVVRAERIG
jgi:LPXTG-site transpeptidase (sortase) family protein